MENNESNQSRTVEMLNGLLADSFTMFLKLWQYHWNVRGTMFGNNHAYLQELYEKEYDRIDALAERIRVLDGRPVSSMREMLERNHIQEVPATAPVPTGKEIWVAVHADWMTLIGGIKMVHGQLPEDDLGTRTLLEDTLVEMEKEAWMIRSRTE